MCYFNTLVNTSGGRWFDENWKPTIDTPEWKAALTRYKRLVDRYGPPDTVDNNFNENLTLFLNGHCAMWIDATVAAGLLFNPRHSSVYNQLGFASAPIVTTDNGANGLSRRALNYDLHNYSGHRAHRYQVVDGQMEFLQQHQRYNRQTHRKPVDHAARQQHVVAKPDRQVENHAHHGSRHPGQSCLHALVAGHGLNKRGTGENKEKQGKKVT